ncbi:MAG TPA: aspartate-semialdehyde dehydrogenase [Candidatus Bathyarchaeota archaeon]|nr:MAG: aspartate-semialdehyde dehydrogenase [Candidatus Bathyarchaeota archaeon B24-2]HDN62471.1 aspartate-semialdehyde dehydrogenase [Candidatus Bathyarchaeota archaeon]
MKYNVAILGATGTVGQRFIEILKDHPWFKIEVLAASPRSAGKKYKEACKWLLKSEMPEEIGEMTVVNTDVQEVSKAGNVDLVFSALPGDIAGPVEEEFAKQYPLVSKAKAHRYDEDVPLLIAEVNPDHLGLIPVQKERRGYDGFITTDPNCSTIQLVLSLKPLEKFGIKKVLVSTMQALSGAGYPGVPSMDIIDNVVPFISGEEEKLERETLKIMGRFDGDKITYADFKVSASCNRVNVSDGHLECVFVELEQEPSIEEVKEAFRNFRGEPQRLNLPSAPKNPIIVREERDRPQPRYDRDAEGGMSVVVGRVRKDPIMTVKYLCLGHNTIRGAAGAGVLSAELLAAKKYI